MRNSLFIERQILQQRQSLVGASFTDNFLCDSGELGGSIKKRNLKNEFIFARGRTAVRQSDAGATLPSPGKSEMRRVMCLTLSQQPFNYHQ
jgi:hypothetical protein